MMDDHYNEEEEPAFYYSKRKHFWHKYKYWIVGIVAALLITGAVLTAVFVSRAKHKNNITPDTLSIGNILSHLSQLQSIANNNNGTRVIGSPGFTASTEYIVDQLRGFGYQPVVQYFNVPWPIDIDTPKLTQISPEYVDFVYGYDFDFLGEFFGSYNITANASVVNGQGCHASDYNNVAPNSIAVISRGNCSFAEKIAFAQGKNAKAVVVYNQGDTADRTDIFYGDMGKNVSVPVFSASYKVGVLLGYAANSALHLSCNRIEYMINTSNVIAETSEGRSDRVIVVGSHLDSVPSGPGINDNGSGSAMNLEVARLTARTPADQLVNKVRFCWWGGEEEGLLGSYFYLNNMNATNPSGLGEIYANLNYDMIASPNYIRGIYNGSSDPAGPGSGVIQSLYEDWMHKAGFPYQLVAFDGRSDYGPFLEYGIPAGGLDAGADGVKSPAERDMFGGLANVIYDPCYHQACDTYDNLNTDILNQLAQAAASVLGTLAATQDLQSFLSHH